MSDEQSSGEEELKPTGLEFFSLADIAEELDRRHDSFVLATDGGVGNLPRRCCSTRGHRATRRHRYFKRLFYTNCQLVIECVEMCKMC